MQRLAAGDFGVRLGDEAAREYPSLSNVFNEAADHLESLLNLNELINTVESTSEGIINAAHEMSSAAEELSDRSENQSGALDVVVENANQLSSSVRDTVEHASTAETAASMATDSTKRGTSVMADANLAIDKIEKSSAGIQDVTSLIESIAFQTNLLALNAAVEAARAGEAGRGFAVVATEVRSLAQRCTDAVSQIGALIAESAGHVSEGAKLVRSATSTLDEIGSSVGAVAEAIAAISSATHEQQSSVEQVSDRMGELGSLTEANKAEAQRSAEAARTLLEQAEGLRSAIAGRADAFSAAA